MEQGSSSSSQLCPGLSVLPVLSQQKPIIQSLCQRARNPHHHLSSGPKEAWAHRDYILYWQVMDLNPTWTQGPHTYLFPKTASEMFLKRRQEFHTTVTPQKSTLRPRAVFSSMGKSQDAWHQALGAGSQRCTFFWQYELPGSWRIKSLWDVATFLTGEREPLVSGEAELKRSLLQGKGYHCSSQSCMLST